MARKILVERWDLIVTIVTVIIAVILMLTNVMPSWALNPLLVTILGIFAFNQLRENFDREDHLERLERLYGSSFKNRTIDQREFYVLLQQAVTNAKHRVLLTHIEPTPPQMSGIPEKVEYFKAMDRIIKAKREVMFRRIYAIPDEPIARARKLEWLRGQVLTYRSCSNFNVRVFDQAKQKQITPPLSLQITDSSEVLVIDPRRGQHTISEPVEDLWSNDPEVVKHLERYYEVFWKNCTIIKEGDLIEWGVLAELMGETELTVQKATKELKA